MKFKQFLNTFTYIFMNTAYLCLGGNMGVREQYLTDAITLTGQEAGQITACSPCYETPAWGVENQAPYLNCCVAISTGLEPEILMKTLLGIEQKLGRVRGSEQYAPRTIDMDIMFYDQDIIATNLLSVPHPRMHLRRFVLTPLNDIAPLFLHPVLNKTVSELLAACQDNSPITRIKTNLCTSALKAI